jgi:hypothetical protein
VAAYEEMQKAVAERIDPQEVDYGYGGATTVLNGMALGLAQGGVSGTDIANSGKRIINGAIFATDTALQGGSMSEIVQQGWIGMALPVGTAPSRPRRQIIERSVRSYSDELLLANKDNPVAIRKIELMREQTLEEVATGKFDQTPVQKPLEKEGGLGAKTTKDLPIESEAQPVPGVVRPGTVAESDAVAGGTETATARAQVPAEAQMLWDRMNKPEGFVTSNRDEKVVKDLYDEGLIKSPEDVQEVMSFRSVGAGSPADLSPSSQPVGMRQDMMMTYLSDAGREVANSRERSSWAQDLASAAARDATEHPEVYVRRVMEGGDPLSHEEAAGLFRYEADLVYRQRDIRRRVTENPGDPANRGLDAEYDVMQSQIDRIGLAVVRGGSEAAARLNIQKLFLNEQMDPVWLAGKAERKKGSPLTDQERETIKQDAQTISELRQQVSDAQKRWEERTAREEARKPVQEERPARTKEGSKPKERAERLKENLEKLRELIGAGC